MRIRKYKPLGIEQEPQRKSLAPSRNEINTVAVSLVGQHTGTAYGAPENATISRVQIFRELVDSLPELTPLPDIAKHAAMYPPRLSELREDLKPLGLTIQCYEERVKVPGSKFKQNRSFYRIERRENLEDQPATQSMPIGGDCAGGALFSDGAPARSMTLDYERGARR